MQIRQDMQRRQFVRSTVAALPLLGFTSSPLQSTGAEPMAEATPWSEELANGFTRPVFIATWPFGIAACERSVEILQQTGNMRDAVERGIHVTELDTSVTSVGIGGAPNAAGVMQLDASFMDGQRQQAGAVAALEGFAHPISVARRVLENSPHAMLVGQDAAKFARSQGFTPQNILTEAARRRWENWKSQQATKPLDPSESHDTIALLGVDSSGHLVGGCSTSGMAYKTPGRVGDSPLIGGGLYVDGEVGAAGATGIGENVLRYCGSFLIVEFMRQGLLPTEACVKAIERIAAGEQRPASELSVNFVALDKQGRIGAAGTDAEFQLSVVDAKRSLLIQPQLVS